MSTGAQSKPDDLSRELFAAQRTVDIAEITMVHGRSHVRTLIDKGDYGFATLIDIEIERLVRAELSREIPEIPLLGEEDGGAELGSEAAWVLDPIDGTANYADGSPLCSISLALVRGGRPVIAIVSAPLLGERASRPNRRTASRARQPLFNPRRVATPPGCSAFAVTPDPSRRRASSRVNSTLASLD